MESDLAWVVSGDRNQLLLLRRLLLVSLLLFISLLLLDVSFLVLGSDLGIRFLLLLVESLPFLGHFLKLRRPSYGNQLCVRELGLLLL